MSARTVERFAFDFEGANACCTSFQWYNPREATDYGFGHLSLARFCVAWPERSWGGGCSGRLNHLFLSVSCKTCELIGGRG